MRTPAKPTTCPNCRAPILTGPDADRAAITRHIDPTPITHQAQLTCILLERDLYELDREHRIYPRPPRRALTHHSPTFTIHAQHICHQPLPAQPTTPRPTHPDTPNF